MSKLARSYIMAELADVAYENIQKAAQKAKDKGFKLVELYEHENAQCYRFVSDHDIVIASRGTEMTIEDIAADLKFRRIRACMDCADVPGLVHRGFQGEALKLWEKVRWDILAGNDGGSHKLWFTGHSLGAAIATLLATYAHQNEDALNTAGLVTFGSPRVGNRTFTKFIDKVIPESIRWVNNDDVVTKVPINLFGRYSHCGHLMYLKKDGTCLSDVSWLKIFADRALGRLYHIFCCRFLSFSDVSDHSINNYLHKIQSLVGDDLFDDNM